jgi:hypothetical protein
MFKIVIERIEKEKHRYDTLGDWYYDDEGAMQIKTTGETEDEAFLIALHELVEYWLCKKRGITVEEVDKFDFQWALEHPSDDTLEPGDDERAPYKKEHAFAMIVENMMKEELEKGVKNVR